MEVVQTSSTSKTPDERATRRFCVCACVCAVAPCRFALFELDRWPFAGASLAQATPKRSARPAHEEHKTERTLKPDRRKIEQEATKNRAKIVEKSVLEPPGRHRAIRGRPGTPPGRRRGGQKRARGAPRALLGCPGASTSALGTCRGAPRALRNAPGEVPRRSRGLLVPPNAHGSARGSIFNVFGLSRGSSDVRFVPLLLMFC